MRKIIGPFTQIITMADMPLKGRLLSSDLAILDNACICLDNDIISAIGQKENLIQLAPDAIVDEINKPAVLLPGFIDSHTHICWAGNRANDLAMRLEGKSYLEIAEKGGGIWSSVLQCRAAGKDELISGIVERATTQLQDGITTIEVKSGYGLQIEAELKVLEAIKEANIKTHTELIPTCLAAHMKPKDHHGDEKTYLQHLLDDLLPDVFERKLAKRIDIFIEKSAFTASDAQHYLDKARDIGFSLTIHGDQFSTGGSEVAINAEAVSVDHLEASTEKEIAALAGSNVIANVLPGASIGLGIPFAPARKLLDAGCCVSIASDWNPGSAPMGALLTQACILSVYEKLTMAEVLAGLTYRAAATLQLSDRGSIAQGLRADMQAYPVDDYRDIIYNQGRIKPNRIWVGGIRQ